MAKLSNEDLERIINLEEEDDGFADMETLYGSIKDEPSNDNCDDLGNATGKTKNKVKTKNGSSSFFKKSKQRKNLTNFDNRKTENFIKMEEVGQVDRSDFIILNDKNSKSETVMQYVKIGICTFLCIILAALIYFAISFKIVPGDVKGANLHIDDFSVISRNYQPNLDELKIGDTIVCIDEKYNWVPYLVKYEKFTYKSRNGAILFVDDAYGNLRKIQSVDVYCIMRS